MMFSFSTTKKSCVSVIYDMRQLWSGPIRKFEMYVSGWLLIRLITKISFYQVTTITKQTNINNTLAVLFVILNSNMEVLQQINTYYTIWNLIIEENVKKIIAVSNRKEKEFAKRMIKIKIRTKIKRGRPERLRWNREQNGMRQLKAKWREV